MDKELEQKLAKSLTAETVELIPYLPYLLQDLWELSTPAKDIIHLIRKHVPNPAELKILDLAAGKGGVGIPLTKELGAMVKMVDVIPQFIDFSREKAKELNVDRLCSFEVEDITQTVTYERNWDCVLLLGVGNVLGNPLTTLRKLRDTIRPGGYVILEETYAPKGNSNLHYDYNHPTYDEWQTAFKAAGLTLVEKLDEEVGAIAETNDFCNKAIAKRAKELSEKHPTLAPLFDGYVKSQLDECYDLENTIEATVCLLQWNK